ncbi:hypothetical protein ACGH2B_01870 [Streptomyces sp. BBFR2]|uniref:hypothetical protein n=1 Tax=Streptomyces sp. BBFR2 TaxID=3372854 RepID=UPI0037D9C47B
MPDRNDSVTIDADAVRRLGRELQEAGRELATCLDRYRERCADSGGGYGPTPAGQAAGREEELTAGELIRVLDELVGACENRADRLLDAAGRYRSAGEEADAAVAALRRAR